MAESPRPGGWEEHEREQRRAWLRLTPRQRLDWLWQAKLFVRRAEEARRRRLAPGPGRPGDGGPSAAPSRRPR